jgi:hypothetical protein
MGAATNTQSGEREKLRLEAVTPELLAEVTRRINGTGAARAARLLP